MRHWEYPPWGGDDRRMREPQTLPEALARIAALQALVMSLSEKLATVAAHLSRLAEKTPLPRLEMMTRCAKTVGAGRESLPPAGPFTTRSYEERVMPEHITPPPGSGQPRYHDFLSSKAQVGTACGFDPLWLPDSLFGFQLQPVGWAVRRGRAAILADCGLGKSPMELVWAENVVRHTNRPVLLLTPLAVGPQMIAEAAKFGVDAVRASPDGRFPAGARVVVANYERLRHFSPDDFAGVVCDEAGILKDFDGKTRDAVVEFLRTVPYRLLATATAAPNDYDELGNAAEALGEMGYQDVLGRFFRQETKKDFLGWGRTKYRLRPHAERDFWRWVCSWARAFRKPSDLGFDDGPFLLPPLEVRQHEVKATRPAEGRLFDVPAVSLQEQQEEARRTVPDRCARVADLLSHDRPAVAWCHLNAEGDLLEDMIPGAVQVSGSDRDEVKEEKLAAFAAGQIRVLVTKPSIAGWGLNWQHCAHMTFFPSHSFEQYYQAVRRCWRFGQMRPVVADVVTTEGGGRVMASLQRKADAAEAMFTQLVSLMNDSLRADRAVYGVKEVGVPAWLRSTRN